MVGSTCHCTIAAVNQLVTTNARAKQQQIPWILSLFPTGGLNRNKQIQLNQVYINTPGVRKGIMLRTDYHYSQFMPLLLSECSCKQACTSSKLSCEKLGTAFKGSRVAKRRPTPRMWPPQMVALPKAPPGRMNSQLQHNTCDIQWNWPNGQLPSGSASIISALFTTLHSPLCNWDWKARCNVLRQLENSYCRSKRTLLCMFTRGNHMCDMCNNM